MKKETINKAILEGTGNVHIFCNQQYKGYYIRGLAETLIDRFWDEGILEPYADVEYGFIMVCLQNKAFQREMNEPENRRSKEGRLGFPKYSLTQEEYFDVQKRHLLAIWRRASKESRHSGNPPKELLENRIRNRILLINLDEAGIQESEYLNESIKANKKEILLSLDFVVTRIRTLSHREEKRDYLNRIYTIPAFHCPERDEAPHKDFVRFFEENFEQAYFGFQCDYLQKESIIEYCIPLAN